MTSNLDNTQEIYINSKYDREDTDTSVNWTTRFTPIKLNEQSYGIGLQSAQIPHVAPQFHKDETEFIIDIDGTTSSYTYDNKKIFSTIEEMLLYVTNLINESGLVFSLDTSTRLTKLENSTGAPITLNFVNKKSRDFFLKLGFEYLTNITLNNTDVLISDSFPSLISTTRYYIVCEEIKNNSYSGVQYNSWSIFKSINVDTNYGGYVNFTNTNDNNLYYHDITNTSSIDNLSFRILDDRMRIVDLKNMGVKLSIYLKEYK